MTTPTPSVASSPRPAFSNLRRIASGDECLREHTQAAPSGWAISLSRRFRVFVSTCAAALASALLAAPGLHAANVTWSSAGTSTPGGDGDWTGGSTWWDGSAAVTWTASDNATFSAAGNTTVNSSVIVDRITVTSSAANISILGGAGDITLDSGITATNSANTAARTFTISESVALGANQTWTVNNGGTTGTANLAVSGIISGSNLGIVKAGNGTLTLSGNNTYTGTTTVNAGTLTLANSAANNKTVVGDITVSGGTLSFSNANQIADTSSVTITSGNLALSQSDAFSSLSVSGGTVNFTGSPTVLNSSSFTGGQVTVGARSINATLNGPITIGNFTFSWGAAAAISGGINVNGDISVNAGTTANFSSPSGRLTLNANRGIDVGTGANLNVQWGIVGSGFGLTKNGSGTLTLTGSNTYTGATLVSAGTLLVNGSLAAGSAVTVDSGATLGGSGTINGAAVVNGNLRPGNSPGILTFGSSLTLSSTSAVTMELNGTARGTEYDGIDVTGALTYDGALTITVGSEFLGSTETFSLFTSGSQSGDFDSMSLEGAYGPGSFINSSGVWSLTDSSGNQWSFSQATGNLGFTAVPEPSTWALLISSSLLLLVLSRRRMARKK